MKLSKALLGAMLVGISVQTTSCSISEEDLPKPTTEQGEENNGEIIVPEDCPACGMG